MNHCAWPAWVQVQVVTTRRPFEPFSPSLPVGLPRVHVSTPLRLSSLSRCTAGHVPSHGVLCARRPLGAHWCVTLASEVEVAAVVISCCNLKDVPVNSTPDLRKCSHLLIPQALLRSPPLFWQGSGWWLHHVTPLGTAAPMLWCSGRRTSSSRRRPCPSLTPPTRLSTRYMYYLRLQELASTSPGPRPLVALDNCHVRTSSGNLSLSPTQITNAKVRVMPVPVQCATSPAKLKLY